MRLALALLAVLLVTTPAVADPFTRVGVRDYVGTMSYEISGNCLARCDDGFEVSFSEAGLAQVTHAFLFIPFPPRLPDLFLQGLGSSGLVVGARLVFDRDTGQVSEVFRIFFGEVAGGLGFTDFTPPDATFADVTFGPEQRSIAFEVRSSGQVQVPERLHRGIWDIDFLFTGTLTQVPEPGTLLLLALGGLGLLRFGRGRGVRP